MEINQDMIGKITSLSNDQLRDAIAQVADALGATPAQKRMAVNNAGLIKRKMSNMSEQEMLKYLSKVSPDKQEELRRKLKL